MYTTGVVFLAIAAILLSVFSRKFFFGDGAAGLMDFSELFFVGQWLGFWCTVASLCFFTLAARGTPFPLVSRRALPVALAIALCLSFVIFSVPEWSNKLIWRRGGTGGKLYLETKVRLWQEHREGNAREAVARDAFLGRWKSDDGATLEIRRENAVVTRGEKSTEFSTAACPDSRYRFEMTSRVGVGAHYYRAGLVMSPQYKNLAEGQYPLLTYSCNGRDAAFMVIAPRVLFAVLEDNTAISFAK